MIMDRREAVVKISWVLKSTYLAPTLFTGLIGCKSDVLSSDLLVFNKQQDELINAVSDTILPRTKTPSASDVKVDKYMDLFLKDVFDITYKRNFISGLHQFDENCKSFTGKGFVNLSQIERYNYLNKLDKKVNQEEKAEFEPFYSMFKKLTITIYFLTEEGVKQNLNYRPVPGSFLGDVEFKSGEKIMMGN